FKSWGCVQCHSGKTFTDGEFHNSGIGWDAASGAFADPGRYAITKSPQDLGAFKTPTLRDVAKHAPYMHDGSLKTLRDVMSFYRRGGIKNPHLDPRVGTTF